MYALNAKILIAVCTIGLVTALVAVVLFSQSISQDPEGVSVEPIILEPASLSVVSSTDRAVTFRIELVVINPNEATALLQYVKYTINDGSQRIHVGLIGERPVGFVAGSNFITLIEGLPVTISDEFSIRNTGEDLGTTWGVSAEVSYNFSSVVAGGEHLETFEMSVPTPDF